ncbi:hypothetical protein CHLNCDRAFT_25065, partial [Chlorella variabilis]
QDEFLAAVKEVGASLQPVFDRRPELLKAFEVMCEPERQITFRVPWLDDSGVLRINRGWRVQFSSAIGPYKGGLRFRDGVNLSIIKFLGFEQMYKNALTTLPMGAGKASGRRGGSDFDPKGKSDSEIQRFCQSFMTELYKYIGGRTDIPAGDIGVGAKEIGYLFGQWKRLTGLWTSSLTGKGLDFGGSEVRPEATGFGAVFFAEAMLEDLGDGLQGKRCIVSGSGNVATFCAMKLIDKGGVVLAMSDSKGYIYEKDGFSQEQLDQIVAIKRSHNGSLAEYTSENVQYFGDRRKPWEIETSIDMAFPCATQNEITLDDARQLTDRGCKYPAAGANMPTTAAAVSHFEQHGVVFGPAKAANAGGVAVSGLEMVQNRVGLQWTREEVCEKLKEIMTKIYTTIKGAAEEYGTTLAAGANIAAFTKVAEVVLAQGGV